MLILNSKLFAKIPATVSKDREEIFKIQYALEH